MGFKSFFFGTTDYYKCEHLIKFDGTSIAIEGVSYGNIQFGKLGIERKLVQAASHALMLLDASQYSLCTSIKNIRNEEERDRLTKLMIEDKIKSEKIIQALAALSINPQSKQFQEILGVLIVSYVKRASQIEAAQANLTSTDEQLTLDSLEIGAETISEKVRNLEQLKPELKIQMLDESTNETDKQSVKSVRSEGLSELADAISALRNEYSNLIMHKLDLSDFFQKLAPYLQQITNDPEIRELIGKYNTDALNSYLINLSNEMDSYEKSMQLGGEFGKSTSDQAERKIKLVTYQLLAKMDEIHSYLKHNG